MRSIINRLASLKLTLLLFLLLAAMSALGTFLPQGPGIQGWEQLLGSTGARIAASVGLVDFYHSVWFRFLMAALSLNMAACMWSRIPGMAAALRGQAALGRSPILDIPDEEGTRQRLHGVLANLGFRQRAGGEGRLYHRRAASHLFVFLTHLSVLMIMLFAAAGSTLGFIVTKRIYVGETAGTAFSWEVMDEVPLPFQLRPDDLVIVPNPIGIRLGVLNLETGQKGDLITTHEGDTFRVPGLPGHVTIERFDLEEKSFTARWSGNKTEQGDTAFGPEMEIGNSGLALVPVAFATWPERQVIAPVTILAGDGPGRKEEIRVNHPATQDGVRIYLTDYGRDQFGLPYVGFQFVSDPGETGVWIGCVLFLACATGAVFSRHSCVVVVAQSGRLRVHLSSREDRGRLAGLIESSLDSEKAGKPERAGETDVEA